ncbi:hypothetical protein PCASD_22550 [Puccinia coronata f. sp. avenae]|uniref:Mitochondrial import inner membrane translocase subunit TIM50 n=1 Tax=Puccinia coronata f. sp. avenae TaxID=200324 RepID=A0A2N5S8R7_9BASI|nr:hypothetical protein PCASD_22550 [Puccinia coronata f. sp. avenae]
MFSKQFIGTGLRALQASSLPAARQYPQVSISSGLKYSPSLRSAVNRAICSTPFRDQAHKELFQGADAVADSALDGYYTIRDMPAFEKDSYSSDSFRVSGASPSTYSIQLHPDCLTFLHEMSAHYHQLVIFTSSSYVYARNIVKEITKRYQKAFQDSTEPFSLVLASHNCTINRGERRKDLDAFGSLSDVVFVDDEPYYSMEGQNDNVIQVRRYHGDESEEPGLMAIAPLLTYLSSVKDVSQSMRDFKKVWHKAGLVKVVPSTLGITC